jgi:hypothetical protein
MNCYALENKGFLPAEAALWLFCAFGTLVPMLILAIVAPKLQAVPTFLATELPRRSYRDRLDHFVPAIDPPHGGFDTWRQK